MTDTDWKIEWATVYANAKDVAYAKKEGTNLSIGDVLWRRARTVGPLTIEHNHWTGWVLDCDEADVLLAASAPRLKAENERLVQEVERLRADNERLRMKRSVWVVTSGHDYSDGGVEGVFQTREDAMLLIERLLADGKGTWRQEAYDFWSNGRDFIQLKEWAVEP